MREIKFRAWDEQKKFMHTNFQFIKSGETGSDWLVFTSDQDSDYSKQMYNPYFQEQLKIMQYTELKDKNGKEIYEGDIIRSIDSKGNEIIHSIIYEQEYARFAIIHKIQHVFDTPMLLSQEWIGAYQKEIIGNIYENPELIENIK